MAVATQSNTILQHTQEDSFAAAQAAVDKIFSWANCTCTDTEVPCCVHNRDCFEVWALAKDLHPFKMTEGNPGFACVVYFLWPVIDSSLDDHDRHFGPLKRAEKYALLSKIGLPISFEVGFNLDGDLLYSADDAFFCSSKDLRTMLTNSYVGLYRDEK